RVDPGDRPPAGGYGPRPLPAHGQPAEPGEPRRVSAPDLDQPLEPVQRAPQLRALPAARVRHLPLHLEPGADARPDRRRRADPAGAPDPGPAGPAAAAADPAAGRAAAAAGAARPDQPVRLLGRLAGRAA